MCPANLVITPGPGRARRVNYPLPMVSDIFPARLYLRAAVWFGFPGRTATITCNAIDAAGNRASCTHLDHRRGAGAGEDHDSRRQARSPNSAAHSCRRPTQAGQGEQESPFSNFIIENKGFSPLVLTLNGIRRTGSDVDNRRITDPDDRKIFAVRSSTLINPRRRSITGAW